MNEIGFNAAANITRMSELRHTGNGQVLTVGLAVNPRRLDGAARKWVDGTPTFIDASVWGPRRSMPPRAFPSATGWSSSADW